MNMKDVLMKGIGCWLLAIVESIMVFGSYILGHFVNHIPAEFAIFLASILGATQILLFLVIKTYFGLTSEEVEERNNN